MKEKTGHFGWNPLKLRDHYRESIHGIIKSLWNIEVPLVGAINGPAIGLGNDVASLCDIRIASKNAKFAASLRNLGTVVNHAFGGTERSANTSVDVITPLRQVLRRAVFFY